MNRLAIALLLAAACGNSKGMLRIREEGPGGPDSFRVAVLHLSSRNGARRTQAAADAIFDENFERTAPLVREAALRGAKVIVTPEYINTGIFIAGRSRPFISTKVPSAPTAGPVHEIEDGAIHGHLRDYSRLADEVNAYVVTDVMECVKDEDDPRYYNTMVAFDPQGRLVARYRKINRYFFERFLESAGDETVSFDTPWGRFGMLLCFDTLIPWTWSQLTRKHKVDFLVTQTLWEHTPFTGHMAMNLLAGLSGRTVLWANQQRGGLGGGAGVIRPWASDTSFGVWGPPGVIVANLPIPERFRSPEANIGGNLRR